MCAHMITDVVATFSRLLKMMGFFAKESYQRDDIPQKRLIILRSLLIVVATYANTYRNDHLMNMCYGVATVSRLLKTIGLFCRILFLS